MNHKITLSIDHANVHEFILTFTFSVKFSKFLGFAIDKVYDSGYLELDIEFIDEILLDIELYDYEAAKRCLKDWKNELIEFKERKYKKT